MTDLLYLFDSNIEEFEATVTAISGVQVALDRTSFYPGGGGQPCDHGRLAAGDQTWRVTQVKSEGLFVWHTLEGSRQPIVGQALQGKIDWERRHKLMRTHTAMHILCGVVWRDYGAKVTGGNMQLLRGRMDFEFETMRAELVREIEQNINEEVAFGRQVSVNTLPREEALRIPDLIRTKINLLPDGITEVRTVEIEGLDLQADGGTHVSNTSEVGRIRVVDYKSKGAINKRIVVALD